MAVMAWQGLCFAGEAQDADMVKVIDKPERVVVTQKADTLTLRVNGNERDWNMHYEWRVSANGEGGIVVSQREGVDAEHGHQHCFNGCDSCGRHQRFIVFSSDIYFGFGSNRVDAANRGAFKRTVPEVGILNLVGLGYRFNRDRSQLSLGVGCYWTWCDLREPYFWTYSDQRVVGLEKSDESFSHHEASLLMWSMQFPLMLNQHLGKSWDVAVGAVLNWNKYARINNSYRVGKTDHSATTHDLRQHQVTVDYVAMASWHGFGIYFRYAPQRVFKTGFGPQLDHRWAVGLVFRGWSL